MSSTGTPYDRQDLGQIGRADFNGFDRTFLLSSNKNCATLLSERSGIRMTVSTNQPALVVFTPENLNSFSFKKGTQYSNYPAICFEAQNFPDAPNHPNFPSSLLLPGDVYENNTSFKFSVE